MNKKEYYIQELQKKNEWESYLLKESGLPGKRANLELVYAVADMGDESLFQHFLSFGAWKAPTNSPYEFLALCGIVGLGRLVSEGRMELLEHIRFHANDTRWRIREGVVIGLLHLGKKDMDLLLEEMERWSNGSLLEKRAAAAALCHPELLSEEAYTRQTLTILDSITGSICAVEDRRSDEFKSLRKGMGYCLSIAVAALPEMGKQMMEKWLSSEDKDVLWIMKTNLGKNRLTRMDEKWVMKWKGKLGIN